MSNVQKKKLVFGVIVVCAVMSVLGGLVYYKLCMDPYRGTVKNREYSKELDTLLGVEEALEDLEYMMERFRNHHPAWLEENNKSVEAVEKQYGAEVAAIKEAQGEISVLALYQAASRIAAMMHDGHTYPYWSGEELRYIHDFTQVNTLGKP